MTFSGPAGSPESDGAPLTRREARALREAAAAAGAKTETAAGTPESAPLSGAVPPAAVPLPPAPVASFAPDLADVVKSTISAPHVLHTPSEPRVGLRPSAARPTFRRFAPAITPRAAATASSRTAVPPRRARRSKAAAKVVTLLAIPALFLTTGLPSYAFSPQGGVGGVSAQPIAGEAQVLTVGAAAARVSISTDGFTATSQAELDAAEAALAQQKAADAARAFASASASAGGFAAVGIRAEGDDYPWPSATTDSQGGGLSPLGYYYRECVDFVAWRLNRDAGSTGSPWRWTWSNLTPTGGNGSAWAAAWKAQGRPTGTTPVVGAVASFTYNHVAYVQSVPGDGTVVLEEYNWMGSHAYHTRTVPISEVKLFLYPPS